MNKKDIKQYLLDNDFSELEEMDYSGAAIVYRAFYDFDEDEIKAAKAYAKDESDYEEDSDEWLKEFFLPYLTDLAIDNVGQCLEEIMEEFEVTAQFISYEIDMHNYSYLEFILAFSKDEDLDIDEIVEEIGL